MLNWPEENNQDKIAKIILFLISPFVAALYSLKTLNRRSSYVVYFLFAIFFGMAFTVSSGKTEDFRFDGAAYHEKFDRYLLYDEHHFYEQLNEFLSFEKAKNDFYFDSIAYSVSRFTENYHVLFLIFAVVFAFFSLKSFRFFTQNENYTHSLFSLILVFLFFWTSIFNINGARFWTAAWVGIYAVFQIYINQNKRYYFLAFLTPFFHASYWFFIVLLLIIHFFKKFEKTWTSLFIISFFISGVGLAFLDTITDQMPDFVQNYIESYTSDEKIESVKSWSGFGWVSKLSTLVISVYFNLLVYILIKNSTEIKQDKVSRNFYLFLITYVTLVNFFMAVPSLGNRYIQLAYPFLAFIWLDNRQVLQKYDRLIYFIPLFFGYHIYRLIFSYYLGVTEIDFWFMDPFSIINKYLIQPYPVLTL